MVCGLSFQAKGLGHWELCSRPNFADKIVLQNWRSCVFMLNSIYMCCGGRGGGQCMMYIVAWFMFITNHGLVYLDSMDGGIRGFVNLQIFCTELERQAAEPSPDSQGDLRPQGDQESWLQEDLASDCVSPLPQPPF